MECVYIDLVIDEENKELQMMMVRMMGGAWRSSDVVLLRRLSSRNGCLKRESVNIVLLVLLRNGRCPTCI
jgi:hypothetical protein